MQTCFTILRKNKPFENAAVRIAPSLLNIRGWGNGYVAIPEGHPLYEVHYNEIDIEVHGGLTYGRMEDLVHPTEYKRKANGELLVEKYWVIGFDTAHYEDNIERWPEEAVRKETMKLLEQVLNYGIT